MAEADTQSPDRCKALTADGERCSRTAGDDGFCHQHDESDPTVSESQTAQQDQETEEAEQEAEETEKEQQAEEQEAETEETEAETKETTDPEDVDVKVDVDDERIEGILSVRQTVQSTASDVIGRPFDGVSEITPTEDGWRAVVEVLERRAVPDTQDIIGRYEIDLDEDGVIEGYRRLDRYRRGDTAAFE